MQCVMLYCTSVVSNDWGTVRSLNAREADILFKVPKTPACNTQDEMLQDCSTRQHCTAFESHYITMFLALHCVVVFKSYQLALLLLKHIQY